MWERAARTHALLEGRASRLSSRMVAGWGTPGSPLVGSFELSLERVFGAMAGLREIAIGTVLHGIGVAVAKLVGHGVVTGLATFVRLLGTFASVGIVKKMIAGTFRHAKPFRARVDKHEYRVQATPKARLRQRLACRGSGQSAKSLTTKGTKVHEGNS